MSRIIVVTSGKGGVGKTTSSANLGMALAKLGRKVVLVDADFGLRNLDLLLGLENRIVYTALEVIARECKLDQALVKDKRQPNLSLLAAPQTRNKTAITAAHMKALVEVLSRYFDYVLIDCPAGIESGFQNAIAGAKEAIVVTTPEISAVRDADRVVGLLEANRITDIKLILNRIRPAMVKNNDMMSVEDVLDILSVKLIGVIPDDEQVIVSTNKGEPLVLSDKPSLAGTAYENVAKRLEGKNIEFLQLEVPPKGFFARLSSWISGNS
ncbi:MULTISPECIES: septum site-determining protein MinD [Pseudanabaena]|uniref:Septum site-determining protein MinD n=2 Tax=Pseudanabaena TaxID=1152 RepID=L8MZX3_9CYAN|nr:MULTISPECIES: septum site-determining protein MinD [Pseudanabaena]ELS33046.1 septum site-determining protein MinD [Pseudanabaena biceps PCC 7429]MDG3494731.1 septum site-determining protein MinD [Pseudanabaena catenata USMAC16]TYQ31887.1 septum site-determining protein MinD [Pseudanabaena sp. UWO310]